MNLTQHKLRKSEWEAMEVPLGTDDKKVLKLLMGGYDNPDITQNDNLSLISFMKISNDPKFHSYLYNKYFKKPVEKINKKLDKVGLYKIDIKTEDTQKIKLKTADKIRIENTDSQIGINEEIIYEYMLLNCCKKYLKQNNIIYYYTIIQLLENNIININIHVKNFVEGFISLFVVNKSDLVKNAAEYIEGNAALQQYSDRSLYSHQRDIFNICKKERTKPKLIFYQAPTGTGKTMTPVALTKQYRVIFVCAAKHIGLQLARACVSMEIPIGVAFGCDDPSGVRLHYYAAKDFVKHRRTGGIFRVDHSVGEKAQLIVCDIKSYLPAMYYMLSFNKPEDILLYWDEPTIALDYKTHEIHDIIHDNWSKNEIPNIVLSSATLPFTKLIPNCIMSYRSKFITGGVHEINSYDCKKTISLISPSGYVIVPHLNYGDSVSLLKCIRHCSKFKTILRHFDVEEITKFIIFVQDDLPDDNKIEHYFTTIKDITIINIKLYYLNCLSILVDKWDIIFARYSIKKKKTYESTIYVTTKDASTLTGGPTIFLTDNVSKIGLFYLQQSNIPSKELEIINDTMKYNEKLMKARDKLQKQLSTDGDNEDKEPTQEERAKMREIRDIESKRRELTLNKNYIPNTPEHQYRFHKSNYPYAFSSSLLESDIEKVVLLRVSNNNKLLLLMGIGVFDETLPMEYLEVMKCLAYEQKLFIIIASSDYIYGTNYQFCHGYLSKDLITMTQEKIIQCFGRVGRGNKQQTYTLRLRDDKFVKKVFETETNKIEAINMNRLFTNL
jgi:hypothetical protein